MIDITGRPDFVEANGLRHHLLRYGNDAAPAVLLLPGITSPAVTADFLASRIATDGFSVIVPDIRGRGKSDRAASGGYRLEDYAADVAGIVSALCLDRPTIIGHSLGARIAAAYVVLHAPDAHGLVVMVDPPLSGPGRRPYPTTLESFMRQLDEARRGTTPEAVRAFYPKWPEREILVRIHALPECDETAIRETHAGFENEDFFWYWRQVNLPALLIRGADSPVVPDDGVRELAEANPAIPIRSIPDAGHMIPWDNESGFFDVLYPALASARGPHTRRESY
ncbi:alpha/beta fold hydrolase [Oceaniradius stylonematis]|uniref:alpha/beta fold hydrolase n=1 Tax=Oceaniradius stylonematis TaxID=2184161 RepID=UPI00273D9E35|nr:alpha/beta hydrolase [Oceaniradius stylonematis]